MKKIIWSKLGIREAAAAICEHLKAQGIEATLVGGACVSIYSDNAYESFDLDFVSHEPWKEIKATMIGIGFLDTAADILTTLTASTTPSSCLRRYPWAARPSQSWTA